MLLKRYQENYAAYDAAKERFDTEDRMQEQGPDPF